MGFENQEMCGITKCVELFRISNLVVDFLVGKRLIKEI